MAQLERKREQFWETRLGGRKEAWAALRLSAESEPETAAAVMSSAGLRPFDLDGLDTCYTFDDWGNRYDIPMYVLRVPKTIITDEEARQRALSPEQLALMDAELEVMVRLSNGDDFLYKALGSTTVHDLKEFVGRATETPIHRLRAIFQGRMLLDSNSLAFSGIRDGVFVQIMIKPPGPDEAPKKQSKQDA